MTKQIWLHKPGACRYCDSLRKRAEESGENVTWTLEHSPGVSPDLGELASAFDYPGIGEAGDETPGRPGLAGIATPGLIAASLGVAPLDPEIEAAVAPARELHSDLARAATEFGKKPTPAIDYENHVGPGIDPELAAILAPLPEWALARGTNPSGVARAAVGWVQQALLEYSARDVEITDIDAARMKRKLREFGCAIRALTGHIVQPQTEDFLLDGVLFSVRESEWGDQLTIALDCVSCSRGTYQYIPVESPLQLGRILAGKDPSGKGELFPVCSICRAEDAQSGYSPQRSAGENLVNQLVALIRAIQSGEFGGYGPQA